MIIFNEQNQNHLDQLESLFAEADEALITSPFLMEDLTVFFDAAFTTRINRLTLYTTLPNQISALIRKSNSLVSAFDYAFEQENFEIDIRIVNRLHGKAYLAIKNNNLKKALVTSANLTHSGLTTNHEWGVITDNPEYLESIKGIRDLRYKKVDVEKIIRLLERIDREELPETENVINTIDLSDIIDSNIFEDVKNEIWLKPIGHTESPIESGQKFNKTSEWLHFSKRRPTGVKIDDIIITYGVGTGGTILSVYKVQSEPKHISDEEIEEGLNERWPWYVIGENLTPQFGNRWWEIGLTYNELAKEYLSNNADKPLTDAGTQSFGAFNYGADKLHLDHEFGNWLYNKIINQA